MNAPTSAPLARTVGRCRCDSSVQQERDPLDGRARQPRGRPATQQHFAGTADARPWGMLSL